MKILLQLKKMKLYFQDWGLWTSNPREACAFSTLTEALDFLRRNRLSETEFEFRTWNIASEMPA